MGKPFVSVLIDTYNHERFIEKAIVSVLEQDFPATDREILVVDDGSTDRTPEIARKFEPHVRLLRKENGGQASAFNTGIPECRGEIIAFLDGVEVFRGARRLLTEHRPGILCELHGGELRSTLMQEFVSQGYRCHDCDATQILALPR